MPNPFGIAEGSMAPHMRFAGSGVSERVTVPVKSLKGFTMMVDVAKVVPSAGTTFGRVAPRIKSDTGFELNVECEAEADSTLCIANTWLAVIPTKSASNRILILSTNRLTVSSLAATTNCAKGMLARLHRSLSHEECRLC